MKSTTLLLSIAVLLCVSNLQLVASRGCIQSDGCLLARKYKVLIPQFNEQGERDFSMDKWKFMPMFIFEDKIVVYEPDENVEDFKELTSDSTPEQDIPKIFLRAIFTEIMLDCNIDGNKLCTVKQYMRLNPQHQLTNLISDEKGYNDQCFVMPYVTGFTTEGTRSMMYICEFDGDKIYEFYTFKNTLSRSIDAYQISVMVDNMNSMGAISRLAGYFNINDENFKYSRKYISAYFHTLEAFKSTVDQNIKTWRFPLISVKNAELVTEGITSGEVPTDWKAILDTSVSKLDKPDDDCCMYFSFEEGVNLYVCIADFDRLSQDLQVCKDKINTWKIAVNTLLARTRYLKAFKELKDIGRAYKVDEFPDLNKGLMARAQRISDWCAQECTTMKRTSTKVTNTNCDKQKEDEIQQEIRVTSQFDTFIKDALEAWANKALFEDQTEEESSFLPPAL